MPRVFATCRRLMPPWRSRATACWSITRGRAADVAAFQLGPAHAAPHPFHDQVALQLGDGADDDHHGAAQRAARVDVLPEADELDVEVVHLIQHLQQVFGRGW